MRRKLIRIFAGILLAIMMVSSVPSEAVYAVELEDGYNYEGDQENSQNTEELITGTDQQDENGETNLDQNDHTTLKNSSNEEEDNKLETEKIGQDSDEKSNAENQFKIVADDARSSSESMSNKLVETDIINFVYIESPYLQTPGTQRIVFSLENVVNNLYSITLTVEDEAGNKEEWPLKKQAEGVYLFEKEYKEEKYSGIYHVVSLNLVSDDEKKILTLSDMNIEAEFGVNEEYDGIAELQPIEAEQSEALDAIDSSVVAIDENSLMEAKDDIVEALNVASAETMQTNTYSRTAKTSQSGNIVVALDPGHDEMDAGAQGYGLKEEELTLKIANYCKEELEQYGGVEVYMTRTSAACPYNKAGASCIQDRVNAAADAGARIFISFHLNSSIASSAKGAEVIIQNKNWRPEVAEDGEKLASAILDELVKVGLTKRSTPIYSKSSADGSEYQDGSLSDYFAVQRYSKMRNIPGIIVEHAFISNKDEVNSFLKSEAGLKKLGVADATGIAKYLGLSKGYWKTDNQGNKYFYEGGKKVTGEKKIGELWYHFDEKTGAMTTGWYDLPGKRVYYDTDGAMVKGQKWISGKWYMFKESTGAMITGWYDLPEKRVYYDTDGAMVKGEYQIGEKWYYFKESTGAMMTGWCTPNGKTAYYDTDGVRISGEKKIDGKWYHFDEKTGAMTTGWYDLPGKRVYYDTDGAMVKGQKWISGKWYMFKESTGAMITGWYDLPEKRVYYDTDGAMVKGEYQIGEKWYYFKESTGAMMTGWCTPNGKTAYYDTDGVRISGEKKIDGKWYHFDEKTGAMTTGWYNLPNKRVYYNDDGVMVKGEMTIGGKTYYFKESTGELIKDSFVNRKYYGEDGVLVPENEYASIFYKIEGDSDTDIEQMVRFYEENSPVAFPSEKLLQGGAGTIQEFARIYYEEAQKEGIKAEVAWAQTMYETGWLKFGGQVKIEQFNFAGLGATDGGASGASYADVRTGVRAQIQHLKAYASTRELNQICVDPRFGYVTRRSAMYVEILGEQENPKGCGWATSVNYGIGILNLIDLLEKS